MSVTTLGALASPCGVYPRHADAPSEHEVCSEKLPHEVEGLVAGKLPALASPLGGRGGSLVEAIYAYFKARYSEGLRAWC